MKPAKSLLATVLACGMALLLPAAAGAQQPQTRAQQPQTGAQQPQADAQHSMASHSMDMNANRSKRLELHDAMRKLWEDHVTYTRLFIVSDAGNLPDKDATTKRLLKNQEDLGNAIKPYFGNDAGTKLTGLLRDHILIAAKIVDAAKVNDKAKVDAATRQWFANADDIAAFLSQANPESWPISATKPMMHDHLNLTLQEATAQIKGQFADAIAAYDKIVEQAMMMADTLSSGIIKRSPDQFGERQARAPQMPPR